MPIIKYYKKVRLLKTFTEVVNTLKESAMQSHGLTTLLLDTYFYRCTNLKLERNERKPLPKKRKPFIVVESNSKPTRTIVARNLANSLGAYFFRNPPLCLTEFSGQFGRERQLLHAYLQLGLYASAYITTMKWYRRPVVMTGYYLDKVSYPILTAFRANPLPVNSTKLYGWPKDLLRPDVTFYAVVPDNLTGLAVTTSPPTSWKNRVLELARHIEGNRLVEYDTSIGFENITNEMHKYMKEHFVGKFDFNLRPVYKFGHTPPPLRSRIQ